MKCALGAPQPLRVTESPSGEDTIALTECNLIVPSQAELDPTGTWDQQRLLYSQTTPGVKADNSLETGGAECGWPSPFTDTLTDWVCSFCPSERGYVRLLPVQNSSQEVKLGGNLELQVLIEAYPRLSHWSWTHENPSKHSVSAITEDQMIPGNNRYSIALWAHRQSISNTASRILSIRNRLPLQQTLLRGIVW